MEVLRAFRAVLSLEPPGTRQMKVLTERVQTVKPVIALATRAAKRALKVVMAHNKRAKGPTKSRATKVKKRKQRQRQRRRQRRNNLINKV